MKNLLILISFLFLIACNNNINDEKYSNYIFDSLKVKPLTNTRQSFMILNPRSSCTACYLGAIKNITKICDKYEIKIITNYDISRYIENEKVQTIIDDDLKFIEANPSQSMNSNFLVFINKKLILNKSINTYNADSIEYYINAPK